MVPLIIGEMSYHGLGQQRVKIPTFRVEAGPDELRLRAKGEMATGDVENTPVEWLSLRET